MSRKAGRPTTTPDRIKAVWEELEKNPQDRPTVTEFARRVGIATSTLYYRYPEWADRVRARRDGPGSPRERHVRWRGEAEAKRTIALLRKQVRDLERDLAAAQAERDGLKVRAAEAARHHEANEVLRATLVNIGMVVRRHTDMRTAHVILDEVRRMGHMATTGNGADDEGGASPLQ